MTVTRIEFGESSQPGEVTLITVEDRVASQDAATRAEDAATRAEAAQGTFTAPANDVVATMVTNAGPTKTALDGQYAPLGEALWSDDFGVRVDGAIAGTAPEVGTGTWSVSGAQPPQVSAGALVSSGVGYAYAQFPDVADLLVADVEWVAPDSSRTLTMAWVTGAWNLNNLANHFSFGPSGFEVTVKRGTTFYPIFSGAWRTPMKAGARYVVMIGMVGDRLAVFANGDVQVSPRDPRIVDLAGSTAFWEPLTVGASSSRLHRVGAYLSTPGDALSSVARLSQLAGAGVARGYNGDTRGSANRMEQVAIGDTAASGTARVAFGADDVRAIMASASVIGATSIATDGRIAPGSTVTINPGLTDEETVVTSGSATGSTQPFTIPVPALTKAHAAGSIVFAVPPASRQTYMEFNPSNGFFSLPNLAVLIAPGNNLYLGSTLDTFISRIGAGLMAANGGFRLGRFASTARPVYTSGQGGALIFDTTLAKAILWNGTAWVNLDGTAL